MDIGKVIATRRMELSLSTQDLAKRTGVSEEDILNWEAEIALPRTEQLEALASALEISINLLFQDHRTMHPAWALKETFFSETRMFTWLRGFCSGRGLMQTARALPFMREKHKDQTRRGGMVPYIVHPLTMANHCICMGLVEDDLLASILLHDLMEDQGVTAGELKDLGMSDQVIKTVKLVSFFIEEGESYTQAKDRYFQGISRERNAILLKLIDRCNNISCMPQGFTMQRTAEYIQETEKYILPMLDILKYSYPECYNAAFLLKYQMLCILETMKRMLV